MKSAKNIDFKAGRPTKSNGKNYFVIPVFKSRDSQQMMAFRTCKEVVAAR